MRALVTASLSAVVLLGATALGCASEKPVDTGVENKGDASGGNTVATNPDGVAYPSDSLGVKAKGAARGDRFPNLSFLGYKNDVASTVVTKKSSLDAVSMANYYDPEGKRYKIIHIIASSVWCGPCNAETDELNTVAEELAAEKVIIIQAMIDGPKQGVGATQKDLDSWILNKENRFTTFLDPNVEKLGEFFKAGAVPWNADIDARSMEILKAEVGAPADVKGSILKWTKWYDSNPSSYK
ncbi:MAG: redoxin domain-containing protein [Polyangiaceae bacterium]|nr:redoxin domain-containing protein [Polyangiaceae bacterium]